MKFLDDVHNSPNCIGCHSGVSGTEDKTEAHEGLVVEATDSCSNCHGEIAQVVETSLHQTVGGYQTILEARGADFSSAEMQEGFESHCYTCHASCTHCHISRPIFAGSGLIKGHRVKKIVSMNDTCLSCHSARVGAEYMGKNEGIPASVHWDQAGMPCFECHEVTDYHGDGTEYAHRYDGKAVPSCLDCHPGVGDGTDGVEQHENHVGKVDCYVCHVSDAYKSCFNCHVAKDDEGLAYFNTDASQMTFKIGRNPDVSEERPYEYVLLRHVPVVPDTFEFYGEGLLSDFDNVPTWKYTTPHNIVRNAPQTNTCNSCHGKDELFLVADDVESSELEANRSVIVEEIPAPQ